MNKSTLQASCLDAGFSASDASVARVEERRLRDRRARDLVAQLDKVATRVIRLAAIDKQRVAMR